MTQENYFEPFRAVKVEPLPGVRFSVSRPDEQGNSFVTVLGDDGAPLPAHKPTMFDREGA